MASRHEIVTIDFRANAAKANPAMESLRSSAYDLRQEIEKTKTAIDEGLKTNMPQAELDKLGERLEVQTKKLRSFDQAMATLSKGVGTLSRAIDAFNTGTLDNMNAAFQKASYNAAEVAKKSLRPDSKTYQKDMAELDALQQKNLENLAKYKLRTEQLLNSIDTGGKISSQDLKQEGDALRELMQILPHMGREWLEYNQLLTRVTDATKQQADAEKRLKGAIVDVNDARQRATQLNREGVEAAARQHKEAQEEVALREKTIEILEKERDAKQKQVSETAALAIAKDKEVEKERKNIAAIQERIDNEERDAKKTQTRVENLNKEAETLDKNAKISRESAESMKTDLQGVQDELVKVNEELTKMGTNTQAAATAANEKQTQSTEKKTAAKEKEVKVEEQVVEAQKQEEVTVEQLIQKNQEIRASIEALYKEKALLIEQQEQSAKATEAETNAFKDLTKEQAKVRLEQKQQLATFKNEGGKWQITNREEAQKYLFDVMGDIDASYLGKTKIEGGAEQASQLIAKFRERYGIQGDSDAMGAMRELMWGGGIIKQGAINKNFVAFEQDIKKYDAYEKELADLTQVINGETKAVEENVDIKQRLEQVNAKILDLEQQSRDISLRTRMINEGRTEQIEEETEKNEHLNVSRKKSVELLKEMIEAYKGLSAEQASAEKKELTKKSTIGFKDGKLDVSNLEEVQDYILRSAQSITGKKVRGSVTLKENQVDKMVEDFASRYGWSSDMANANKIFKQIIQGKEGLFKGGMASLSGAAKDRKITIQQDTEAVDKRNAKLSALTAIAEGAAKGIDKVTKATDGETDAIKIWAKEVDRRHKRYEEMDSDLKKADEHLKKLRAQKGNLPKTGADAQLLREEKKEEIDKFTKETFNPLKKQTEVVKKSWESALKDYIIMTGREVEETQQVTAAENQEAAATEKVTKGKKGKTKATKEAADATKEATKASQEATEQAGKQSAEEKKQEDLLKKKQELEEKQGKLIGDIAQKEEEAAGMETKAANKRTEATRAIEEQAGAHEKNNKDMGIAQENMKGLEEEQAILNGKLGEGRKEIAEYNKKIDENAEKSQQAQQKAAQSERLTIDVMTEAVKILEERNRAIEPEGKEWQENTRLIQQYKAELDRLKQQPVLQLMTERMGNIKNLSAEALQETKKFWQAMEAGAERGSHKLEVAVGNLRVIAEEERQRRMEIQKPMRENLNNLSRLSTNDLAETKKYWETVRDGAEAGSVAYKKAELAVKALNNEENRRKSNAQAQYIHDQMLDLNNLSVSGLAEVKKYWQAMYDGAKKGSDEMKDAEAALKRINALETERSTEALKVSANRLNGNLGLMSAGDLHQAIDDAKKYQLTLGSTSEEAKKLAERIVTAEEHIKRYGVEAEREARRQEEADKRAARAARDKADAEMQAQQEQRTMMMQRSLEDERKKLSAEALAETKKYWEAVARGAEEGSVAQRNALTIMQRITDEELRRNKATNERKASILGGDLSTYSEAEVREAIEAGKQLVQTYQVGSDAANELSTKIVNAENYIRQYGVEAERAAQKQAQSIAEMQNQLAQGTTLSQTALKAQEKYWQELIDDPKTAAASLDEYRANLEKVKLLQDHMAREAVSEAGEGVLSRMRGDVNYEGKISENQRKEDVAALQAYRDSLPKEDNTSVLKEIDYYLKQLGATAKETAQDVMSVNDALMLAAKAGTSAFAATPQEIQAATKAIEKQRDAIIQTIKAKRESGQATDKEEKELQDLTNKLRGLKFELDNVNMSQAKMQALMEEPTNAVNLDELRAAIKRADGELRHMQQSLGENSKQYQEFAEKVKNSKNVLKEMESQAKANTSTWDKAWSRLKTYVGMYMGFNMALQRISGAADDMLELSDKMGEVRKTTGFTADEVGRLSDNLKKLDTRADMTRLMEFSSLAGSIGLKTEEQVQGFSEAANMLAVSLPEMGNEASRTLIKIADATGDLEKNGGNVRETLERVGSTIIALRANSAAAAGPITDFVSRVGAVGAQAGISIDQIAALGATVDALGGRVEMSATALSRMIPAIKNNTFEVARAIGMTEKELKGMTGMEQMVAIFRKLHDSVKQFDMTTEDGMNGAADAVENMLGRSVSMQDVMKQLNQQGARAGIVFGLLSQNVDKLEEQLGTAREAYANNVALMNEYNKMNDTAAGKWARLKNQLEEFFVNADAQSWISDVIDWLRKLIDLITEEGPIGRFFRWSLVYLALWKAKWTETIGTALISLGQYIFATKQSTAATAADTAAKTADAAATEATAVANEHAAVAAGKFNKTMKANVIAAVATAVVALGWALYEYAQKAKKAAKQMDVMADVEKKAREESVKERAELEKLYKVTQDQTASMEERKKALKDMVGDAKYQEYYSKLSTESELASAAASAYKELSEQILATARARALDAKAEELQRRRIDLEDQRKDREDWEKENRGKYRAGKQEYTRQQAYVGSATGGATAGFQESQIAQRGSAAMKPAIIDEFEGSVRERNRINGEIEQIDKDIDKLKQQVSKLNLKKDTGDGGGGGGGGNNPYGNYDRVKSDYNDWDANALVNRRKEMLERVRALANGADVQAVLSEDAKFISEAVRKNIKTTSDAIEWYNTERLKIQEALHGKHLTNTGDWMDPKQQKIRRKLMQDDMKAYLEELDAYYTERNQEIEKVKNDEEITEAEAWRRTIKNEEEWYRRRAELQIMYSNKHKQIAEDEQQTIAEIIAERTGDDATYIKATIANTRKFSEAVKAMNEQGAKEYRKFQGDLDLGAEKSYLKSARSIGKYMKFIEDTLAKERPYDGITKNLQENLDKMGILAAQYKRINEELEKAGQPKKYTNAQITAATYDEMAFFLKQAENAWSIDIDELLRRMVQEGMVATAEEISKSDMLKQAVMGQLRKAFEEVQNAVKKEASQIKKDVEIIWNDDKMGIGGMSMKAAFDKAIAQIGQQQDSVSRANSLIGAGAASDNVAARLGMKQIEVQMRMQKAQYDMYRTQANQRIIDLKKEAAEHKRIAELAEKEGHAEEAAKERLKETIALRDAENVRKSLGLTLSEETKKEEEQKTELLKLQEESQNRLYTSLREWADLFASSIQSMFEATHAGDAEYYNELAKLNLTGKGGPGAGTYIVIDNEGTKNAEAHYEYLDEREALERQHEIERQNAEAEAWKKLMDDLNNKMNDQITDWLNAALQNQALEDNTAAINGETTALTSNTAAVNNLTSTIIASDIARRGSEAAYKPGGNGQVINGGNMGVDENGVPNALKEPEAAPQQKGYGLDWQQSTQPEQNTWTPPMALPESDIENIVQPWKAMVDASDGATKTIKDNNKATMVSTQSAFAKMTQAANLYGIAYQAMSNDNMSATQKFEMIAIQAAGQAAITSLTASGVKMVGDTAVQTPSVLSKIMAELGPIAGPIAFGAFTALLGGLMGLATSKLAKSKAQIAQVTGASASAGRLSTGMMTYAEGNVNEFTDPATLTPGRSYNVDAADGRTYRAKYTGTNPRTHLTNGPEFHLAGEKGREMIIDAGTTREITMNETEIWHAIQTLRNGGHVSSRRGMRRGVRAFADGNVEDFETMDMTQAAGGLSPEMAEKFQTSIDRNNDLLERALTEGIKGVFNVYGKGGMVDTYDTAKKSLKSHGERY